MTQKEKDILRFLTDEYMTYAQMPVNLQKINLWKALNRGKMERPMVAIDQLPWDELACDELQLQIEDPYWRHVENNLRQTIYKWRHFPVDMVLDSFIAIPKVLIHTGYGLVPQTEYLGEETSTARSQRYKNLITSMEDVLKIKDYRITHDEKQTKYYEEEGNSIFGDIAPVKSMGHTFHFGVWDTISMYMGIENIYFALADEPELLHAVMERMTQATICAIEDANQCGGHNDNANTCHCGYIYTDELLPGSGMGKGSQSENCWAFGLAQLFTSASPQVFEEFELPYASRMAQYFGMVYYGCCDKLDHKLDMVKQIPNVHKISCSPWSDRKNFAENIGGSIVMSNKPNPAYLADSVFDEQQIRNDLQYTCELAKQNDVNLELILKDVSTIKNQPERLRRWAEIAMDVVQSFA